MKIRFLRRPRAAYALLMVLIMVSVSLLIMAGSLNRTYTESKLNNRNNQYLANLNAAEAATEKVYARMAFDFQRSGLGTVSNNLSSYRTNVPTSADDSYWSNFEFTDGNGGGAGTIYVNAYGTWGTNTLPSQYTNRVAAANSPIYRIVANARSKTGLSTSMISAVQEDVLLALVPITTYAIFYNGTLEFTKCATMVVNGSVHANGRIYVGPGSGATLTFNGDVSSTDVIEAWRNDGYTPPTDKTFFNGDKKTNAPSINLSINMTNTHTLIEIPTNTTPTYANSIDGQQLLYNQANVIILVSNTSVTALLRTGTEGVVPGADGAAVTIWRTNTTAALAAKFPFLTITNKFIDQREVSGITSKTVITTQVDIGKYKTWLANDTDATGKFTGGKVPAILFVADNRTTTTNPTTTFFAVRITNGIAPPANGGVGFSLVTPNPLYVWGDYNCPNNNSVGNSNTFVAGTVPSALMSDALTLLSSKWKDSESSLDFSVRDPSDITVNAAIIAGNVKSTGTNTSQFSGGVHNLPRLLEDWNGASKAVTLNTSLINLFTSQIATTMFKDPGASGDYYSAPKRYFSFDTKFNDPAQQPPGIPCALIPIRYSWAQPPPKTVTYNVTP